MRVSRLAREGWTCSQLASSPPTTRTRARSRVSPWALCLVVASARSRVRRSGLPPPQLLDVNGLAGPTSGSDATVPRRVPPRCTARVPRNSARLEHLVPFDRRREAEQDDRLPPRSPDGRPLAGRRTKPQAGRVGLHHQLPPDRYLNSIPSPEIEATVAGEGEHPSPPRKRRRRPSTSPSRPPSLRSPKHRVCVVTTQGSDAWSSRRSVPMVGSATFPTADRTPSRVGAQVGDGCRGAVAGRGAHCYGKACSPGSSLVRLGSRAWPRLTCS